MIQQILLSLGGVFLVDSYSEANQDADRSCMVFPSGPPTCYQSFTGLGILDSCKLYLKKAAGATGNITAILYAHTGTFGTSSDYTGAALATSDLIGIGSLSTSYALVTFNFSGANKYAMTPGTKYCIAINNPNAGIVYWGGDSSSPSHGGNAGYDYGGHVPQSTLDNCFYVYAK